MTRPRTSALLTPGVFVVVVLGAALGGAGATVYFFNPGTHNFYPSCAFHSLTGLNCPGCGMTRALYALLHGEWRLALKDNALFVGLLALLGVWCVKSVVRKIRNQPASFTVPPKILWLLLVSAVFFGVIRNLPGFEWLSP